MKLRALNPRDVSIEDRFYKTGAIPMRRMFAPSCHAEQSEASRFSNMEIACLGRDFSRRAPRIDKDGKGYSLNGSLLPLPNAVP